MWFGVLIIIPIGSVSLFESRHQSYVSYGILFAKYWPPILSVEASRTPLWRMLEVPDWYLKS